jgi:uncharacterized protein (TIRG00374 family)
MREATKRGAKWFSIAARLAIGGLLLYYLSVSGNLDWKALLGLGRAWHLTAVALAGLLINFAVNAWRLAILLRPFDFHLSVKDSFKLTLIGQFFSTFLPGATSGDVMKIYHAAEGNVGRRTEVATLVLLDRAVGMFAMLLLPVLLVPASLETLSASAVLRQLLWLSTVGAILMLVGFLLTFSDRVRHSRVVEWAFERMPLGKYALRMFDTTHQLGEHPRPLAAAVILSLASQALTVVILLILTQATSPGEPVARAAILVPLGLLANTLPLTPGGLGLGEAAFDRLFRLVGMESGAEAMLSWRLLTTVIGLLGLVYYLQGRRRVVHRKPDAEKLEDVARD